MNRPVRTLLHVYPAFTVGGAQIRFSQLANHFGRDYRHVIVAMNGVTTAFAQLAPDLDASLLDVPILRGQTLANLKTFRRILREVRPDLLVTSNWGSIEWALANLDGKVPHLHMEDGFGPEEANRQLGRRMWTRRLALYRSTVLLPSKTLYSIARDVWRLPAGRMVYVPNGIDCDRFGVSTDIGFAAARGIRHDEPVIGTVAALRAEKNLLRLVEAFAQVVRQRPAQLVLVGDGPERAGLEARAAELGVADRVLFTGACPTPEKLLPAFSLFALSSDTEQMPLSVLEAMAAGRAVVSTDVGDVRRMLAGENDPFVVERDAGRLAEAMLTLLDAPERAAAIGAANARRAREAYDQKLMFAAYRTLFDGEPLRGQEM
ncbi:MAG TPA: glycosyltransferase [Aliidongia sp.]|uniref:glycosyltransferase n=1 Tax=Aliidongia sp. TaxID=1914230 RepID=UPI002DDD8DDD|nr:glycosyltransferase [Aliidongia sp.]HEV2677317.1 glycosyltransferase [Aliidongia sp.]